MASPVPGRERRDPFLPAQSGPARLPLTHQRCDLPYWQDDQPAWELRHGVPKAVQRDLVRSNVLKGVAVDDQGQGHRGDSGAAERCIESCRLVPGPGQRLHRVPDDQRRSDDQDAASLHRGQAPPDVQRVRGDEPDAAAWARHPSGPSRSR
eukprot:1761400-Prymnesium_polylepis.2